MKNVEVVKLGTITVDKATELKGTLTHWLHDMEGGIRYIFQPEGLKEDGQPVDSMFIETIRLDVKPADFETVPVPVEILGTQVRNTASGFNGMAIAFTRHINGCFHVYIQPKGLNKKTNSFIHRCDFDLRSCEGPAITKMNEDELKESKLKFPSPSGVRLDDTPPVTKHH